jgi:hypothetical protein
VTIVGCGLRCDGATAGCGLQSLLLSICAFLLRFGFSTLLIFTLYNNAAAPETDEAVWVMSSYERDHVTTINTVLYIYSTAVSRTLHLEVGGTTKLSTIRRGYHYISSLMAIPEILLVWRDQYCPMCEFNN